MRRPVWLVAALVLVPLAVAACGSDAPGRAGGAADGAVRAPFAGCEDLTRPPANADPPTPVNADPPTPGGADTRTPVGGRAAAGAGSAEPAGAAAGLPSLPEVSLRCFRDGSEVTVADLRGPAVVNLWASWCSPCRRELPVLRDFAERNRDRVRVIGVVSQDSRSSSAALAADLGLRFPHLLDEGGTLMRELNRSGLPVTLLVDADGRVKLIYTAQALDRATLDTLVRERLEVGQG